MACDYLQCNPLKNIDLLLIVVFFSTLIVSLPIAPLQPIRRCYSVWRSSMRHCLAGTATPRPLEASRSCLRTPGNMSTSLRSMWEFLVWLHAHSLLYKPLEIYIYIGIKDVHFYQFVPFSEWNQMTKGKALLCFHLVTEQRPVHHHQLRLSVCKKNECMPLLPVSSVKWIGVGKSRESMIQLF